MDNSSEIGEKLISKFGENAPKVYEAISNESKNGLLFVLENEEVFEKVVLNIYRLVPIPPPFGGVVRMMFDEKNS